MPVWKKTYHVIAVSDAANDLVRAVAVHQHSDDIHLCNFDVDFTPFPPGSPSGGHGLIPHGQFR